METIAGTTIDLDGHGVLLRGPPGSGKSDLALRLIDGGAGLVADDRTVIMARDGAAWASAPTAIRGLLEVRGIGVIRLTPVPETRLVAVVDLVPADGIERMPEPASAMTAGVTLPRHRLAPFESSAVAKVQLVARLATGSIMRVP